MSERGRAIGKSGEDQAARFLLARGYAILARNHRTRYGEIDIVARDRGTVCFVEVKTRLSAACGEPEESVTPGKRIRIARAARLFLQSHGLQEQQVRFDVIAVAEEAGQVRIRHFCDAFEAAGD